MNDFKISNKKLEFVSHQLELYQESYYRFSKDLSTSYLENYD